MSLRGGLKLINACNVGVAHTIAVFPPTQGAAIASPSLQMPLWSSLFMISIFILGFPFVLILHALVDILGTESLNEATRRKTSASSVESPHGILAKANKLKIKYIKIKAEQCSSIGRGILKPVDLNHLFVILGQACPGPDPGQACPRVTEIILQ